MELFRTLLIWFIIGFIANMIFGPIGAGIAFVMWFVMHLSQYNKAAKVE